MRLLRKTKLWQDNLAVFELLRKAVLLRRNGLITLLFCFVVVSLLNLLIPAYLGKLLVAFKDLSFLSTMVLTMIALIVLKLVFQFIQYHLTINLSGRLSLYLKKTIINRFLRDRVKGDQLSSDLLIRVFSEIGIIQGKLIFGVLYLLKDLFFIAALFCLLATRSTGLAVSLVLLMVVAFLLNRISGAKIKSLNYQKNKENARLAYLFFSMVQGWKDIRTYSLQSKISKQVENSGRAVEGIISKEALMISVSNLIVELLIIVFVGISIFILFNARYTQADILVIVSYLSFLLFSFYQVHLNLTGIYSALPNVSRINELLGESEGSRQPGVQRSVIIRKDQSPSLTVKDLRLSNGPRQLFEGLNVRFNAGFNILRGPNGSGKTSLAEVIAGLNEAENGSIQYVFNQRMNAKSIQNEIVLISQTPFFFEGSFNENLYLHPEQVQSASIREAETKILGHFSDINTLRLREIGENGKHLSGGERQILNICRGLLFDPPVLILDEIDNNLSPEIFRSSVETILQHRGDKITILITHSDWPFKTNCTYVNL